MIGLDRLVKIEGVIAAGQFSDDGKVIRAVGDISEKMMNFTAQMCSKQANNLKTMVYQYSKATKMEWRPLVGWGVWGGKYAIVVINNTWVFIDPTYANFNQLVVDLMGTEATGYRQMNY